MVQTVRRLRAIYHNLKFRLRFRAFRDAEQLFTHYYTVNRWGNKESVSGAGSTLEYTENIRRGIPRLTERLGVKTILDAPCGDYNWFSHIPRAKGPTYVGGDIVEPLVRRNQEVFGDATTCFRQLDVIRDELPAAELWLCRDCLFHLSNADVFLTIANFLRSDVRYWLTSTHPECEQNMDIPTGSFRLLNLELPPFGFCKPQVTLDDWIEGFPARLLGIWEREELSQALANNAAVQVAVRDLLRKSARVSS
ncbi:MAG: glycosyl transferase [Armatimonadetes bacterium CG_4_9_14_3_um_filter_66_14]|nr:MAG: glycosyl transferase [Armatimonadetes bacterium CG_4_9_14_3_um_filter_66_14]